MAETKKKGQRSEVEIVRDQDVSMKVEWLTQAEDEMSGTAAGRHLENTELQIGSKPKFNPFIETKKEQTMDYQIAEIQQAWDSGEITDQEAIAAMGRVYTVNHSIGADILDDNRVKPENRIDRYVEWAVCQGQKPEEARAHAIDYLLEKGKQQGSLAGNGWGGITRKRDIRKK